MHEFRTVFENQTNRSRGQHDSAAKRGSRSKHLFLADLPKARGVVLQLDRETLSFSSPLKRSNKKTQKRFGYQKMKNKKGGK